MTESRPPAPSRHADPRSPDHAGANPLDRPLPPGLARRVGGGAAAAAPAEREVVRERPRDAEPHAFRASAPRTATASGPRTPESVAARPAPPRSRSTRAAAAHASEIPLLSPPAWQVAEIQAEERQLAAERAVAEQRGLPGWAGLVVLLVITGIGGIIDAVAGAGIKGTFSIGLIVGALAAILLVRRSSMFPIVVAPPLVYFLASAVLLYVRSSGLSDRAAITDAAASWLVYGFPAIAGATAVVLIVAGVRMILHR